MVSMQVGAMATVEGWAVVKAVAQPHVVTERIWFRAVRKPTDPVLHAVDLQRPTPRNDHAGH